MLGFADAQPNLRGGFVRDATQAVSLRGGRKPDEAISILVEITSPSATAREVGGVGFVPVFFAVRMMLGFAGAQPNLRGGFVRDATQAVSLRGGRKPDEAISILAEIASLAATAREVGAAGFVPFFSRNEWCWVSLALYPTYGVVY